MQLQDIYRGCHQLTLLELRIHLESIAALGIVDVMSAMWAKEELNWDIEHVMLAVDNLDKERTNV